MIFRKLFACGVILAACVLLTGCGTTGGLPTSTQVDQTVTEVQSRVTQICGFLPTVSTVAKIIATFAGAGGVVDVASQAAAGICGAIAAKGARRGAGPPRYRGVTIRGRPA